MQLLTVHTASCARSYRRHPTNQQNDLTQLFLLIYCTKDFRAHPFDVRYPNHTQRAFGSTKHMRVSLIPQWYDNTVVLVKINQLFKSNTLISGSCQSVSMPCSLQGGRMGLSFAIWNGQAECLQFFISNCFYKLD